jgi:alkylhydroperoxidase family enzyme
MTRATSTTSDQLESPSDLAATTRTLAITVLMHENACSAEVAAHILHDRAADNYLSIDELADTIVAIAGYHPLDD